MIGQELHVVLTNGIPPLPLPTGSPYIAIDQNTGFEYFINSNGAFLIGPSSVCGGNFSDNETPAGTVNGVNHTFILARTPVAGSVKIFENGLLLSPGGVHYSIAAATITMNTAPATGALLLAEYRF
jgi:hypothetical protein